MARRDAVTADFLRYYGVPFRDAVQAWPGQDLADAIKNLPPDSATYRSELGDMWDWNHLAANIAELVDLWHYWLQAEYAKWTHDPDDPAVKREAHLRKRNRVKPPPFPLIPPVAHRPPSVAERYLRDYQLQMQVHGAAQPLDRTPSKNWVSSDEFDRVIDML